MPSDIYLKIMDGSLCWCTHSFAKKKDLSLRQKSSEFNSFTVHMDATLVNLKWMTLNIMVKQSISKCSYYSEINVPEWITGDDPLK